MSRLLVVSDNHGDRAILETLVKRERDHVDVMLHLGDSELEQHDPIWHDFHVVGGNVDWEPYPLTETLTLPEGTVFITHGHRFSVRRDETRLADAAREAGATLACFGHTHVTTWRQVNGVWCLNPGSVRLPRGFFQEPTYAIVDWDTGQAPRVTFYTRDGKAVNDPRVPERREA